MNTIAATIAAVEAAGVTFRLEEGQVKVRYRQDRREALVPLLAELRSHREEIFHILQERYRGDLLACQASERDAYHRRAAEVLRRIAGLMHLGEAIRWLDRTSPIHHHHLLVTLPGHLDALWGRVPIAEFNISTVRHLGCGG